MSDDRELVERLAAIDATPRASWVAELRADLDAAWETGDAGYLDSLRTTTLTLVDHELPPSEPSSGHRWLMLIAAAAAVVVAIALVATRDDTPADQPSPTVTVPPSMPPRALPDSEPSGEHLLPGTYFIDEVSGSPTPRIFATIGAGWRDVSTHDGWIIGKEVDIGLMMFDRAVSVFSDACHPSDGYHPGPVTNLDDLVAALSEQRGWADVTAASDISVDGYPGKTFQRTAPADMVSTCDTRSGIGERVPDGVPGYPDFRSWESPAGGTDAGSYYEPGEIETLWVLDLDGTLVVISTKLWPEPSAAAHADFAAEVLDSIRIERA